MDNSTPINTLVLRAVQGNDLKEVSRLLDEGGDVHYKADIFLSTAAKKGLTDMVKLLLDRGANVHTGNDYAVRLSVMEGHYDTTKLLLERGCAACDGALQSATAKGNLPMVELLLDHGANIHHDNDYALRVAACYGQTEVIRLLLERGADIHASADGALRTAIENKKYATVKFLLENGADAYYGLTTAMWKVDKKQDYLKLLLEYETHGRDDMLADVISQGFVSNIDRILSADPRAEKWDNLLLRQAYYLYGSEKAKEMLGI